MPRISTGDSGLLLELPSRSAAAAAAAGGGVGHGPNASRASRSSALTSSATVVPRNSAAAPFFHRNSRAEDQQQQQLQWLSDAETATGPGRSVGGSIADDGTRPDPHSLPQLPLSANPEDVELNVLHQH
jgi:hypothetical protein